MEEWGGRKRGSPTRIFWALYAMPGSTLRPLPRRFFARECLTVAVALLGKLLVHGDVVLRISEVEAYRHPDDSANHCRAGRTARNAPMWGPAGHAYVYLCYGMHALLNLVTDGDGEGAAVLVRAAEPVAGEALIAERRHMALKPGALNGPGKVAQALGLDTRASGSPLSAASGLYVADAPTVTAFRCGPRVGVDYAAEPARSAPWRLALLDSRWVSVPKTLLRYPGTPAQFLAAQRPRALSPRRTRSSPP